ncbi:hypothetical protein H6P81_016468 [Aristolochia fimbriata]|uniref:Uncharacterized protein n=1 Tax=Aristolochia fimbriata TaxID=158543 RepID=A0AAV7ECZ8_ARIFI|nr:hypothetical protein H6P81_016468 [Aristolochia fimbriata]
MQQTKGANMVLAAFPQSKSYYTSAAALGWKFEREITLFHQVQPRAAALWWWENDTRAELGRGPHAHARIMTSQIAAPSIGIADWSAVGHEINIGTSPHTRVSSLRSYIAAPSLGVVGSSADGRGGLGAAHWHERKGRRTRACIMRASKRGCGPHARALPLRGVPWAPWHSAYPPHTNVRGSAKPQHAHVHGGPTSVPWEPLTIWPMSSSGTSSCFESVVWRLGKALGGIVPYPFLGRHVTTRSRCRSSSSSPPTASGFGTRTPVPSTQSQSFSRSYESILPTSLSDIVPSTRGCSPRRPDAFMSTTMRGWHSVLQIFKRCWGCTGIHMTCSALPTARPYLRNFNPIYFCGLPDARYLTGFPCVLGSTNPLQVSFTWNLSPLHPSKFSFEYLLLQPIFALTAPPKLGPEVSLSYSLGCRCCPDGQVSALFNTVSRLLVHPASPVLLTKNGALGVLNSVAQLNEAVVSSYLFKV